MTPNIINLTMSLHRINKLKKQNNISLLTGVRLLKKLTPFKIN